MTKNCTLEVLVNITVSKSSYFIEQAVKGDNFEHKGCWYAIKTTPNKSLVHPYNYSV